MSIARFQFGNVVVVNGEDIGVIVKTWEGSKNGGCTYEVYVRLANGIVEFPEEEISHYLYSKELSEEEKSFY